MYWNLLWNWYIVFFQALNVIVHLQAKAKSGSILTVLKKEMEMGWRICPTTSSSGALKCHWLLFSNAVNCPSISLAQRMLLGQCPIDRAEMGGKWEANRKIKRANDIREGRGGLCGPRTRKLVMSQDRKLVGAPFTEKASKALRCDRRKMGDRAQWFFCVTGGSQGHS